MTSLISIIMPAYNAGKMLAESIHSVLAQSYSRWELLLVNDGSTDNSREVALAFDDGRIHYFEQENKGVSAARNLGLSKMTGDYFCFLDADDIMPPHSIRERLAVFKESPELCFVDGRIKTYDAALHHIKAEWHPAFQGNPLEDLVCLTGKSFFGPTWMIKRKPATIYRMQEELSHGEDLLFYMALARDQGIYGHTDEVILHYRDTPGSAMKNLKGLEKGYKDIEKRICQWPEVSARMLDTYRRHYRKAMFKAYIKQGNLLSALAMGGFKV